ncbi:hypothetical protein [Flavobacterium hercynium]|uniref:Uncharacterized protein n=1 Tax=Flavobacterium hercynium TaxID=387094 RepID=A0A226H3N1_9FLAO|nr:hypothetical protein [Flavobacterium hercynium]OXA88929.1 hypothetical protein B0A66_14375 [Flavobacterium hercynium]SMP28520.1 hypothetical protein SAMN06265346_11194 [Flavobacterium hercynium]
MKVSDNVGLEIVTKIINENVNVKMIKCFLEKKKIKTIKPPYDTNILSYKEHTHFHILVLTDDYTTLDAAAISALIQTKTQGRYSATILMY